jgi:diphosphomevalonate decarboxylase
MTTQEFLGKKEFTINNKTVSESCPSNIALIKYWGKYDNQIPAIRASVTH